MRGLSVPLRMERLGYRYKSLQRILRSCSYVFPGKMTIEDIKETLSPVFERSGSVRFAYLFGSMANGGLTPLSDIDIAIYLAEGNTQVFFDLKLSLHADICRALKRNDVDLVVLNTTENLMLLDDIIRNSIVLYDKNAGLRDNYELKVLHQVIDFKTQRLAVMGI